VPVAAALIVLIVISRGLTAHSPAADEPYYGSAKSLREASDVVVLGMVRSSDSSEGPGAVRTVISVDAFTGDATDGTLVVTHPSAAAQPGMDLRKGAEYVLLLDRTGPGEYVLVNIGQGALPVVDGKISTSTVLGPEVLGDLGLRGFSTGANATGAQGDATS